MQPGTARLPRRPSAPRNDKPLAFAILTMVCTSCRCTAERGQPGPYNAWPKARELFILHFSVFSIHLFLRAPPLQRTSGSLVKFYTTKYPPFPDTGCRFRRYIPFFRRDYREEEVKIERRFLRVLRHDLDEAARFGVHRRKPHHLRLVLAKALRARDGNLLSLEFFQNISLLRLVIGEPRLSLQVISNSGVSAI